MRIEINRQRFIEALNTVKDGCGTGMPVVQNIKMETIGDTAVKLTATDLDVTVTTTVDCKVAAPGATTAKAKMLVPMVGALSAMDVTFDSDDTQSTGKATLSGGGVTYKVATITVNEFPKETEVTGDAMAFRESELKDIIRKTAYACSADATRRSLMGLCFQGDNRGITAVGTDGRRLAMYEAAKDGTPPFEMVVPQAATRFLLRMLSGDKDVSITLAEGKAAKFTTDTWTLQTKLVADKYPNYRQVIPQYTMDKIQVGRNEFSEAIRQATVAAAAQNTLVMITFKDNVMGIKSKNDDDSANADVMLPVKYDGAEKKIALNPKYILDILGAMDEDEVWFNIMDGMHPITITSEGGKTTNVIMPLRVN